MSWHFEEWNEEMIFRDSCHVFTIQKKGVSVAEKINIKKQW